MGRVLLFGVAFLHILSFSFPLEPSVCPFHHGIFILFVFSSSLLFYVPLVYVANFSERVGPAVPQIWFRKASAYNVWIMS